LGCFDFNHPLPLLKIRRGVSYLPLPLLAKEGSFAPNLSLFRRALLSAECSNVLIQTGLSLPGGEFYLRNLRVEKY
jgi:hypothetical protein